MMLHRLSTGIMEEESWISEQMWELQERAGGAMNDGNSGELELSATPPMICVNCIRVADHDVYSCCVNNDTLYGLMRLLSTQSAVVRNGSPTVMFAYLATDVACN